MPAPRPPEWEPEPLRLPVDPSSGPSPRRAPSTVELDEEPPARSGDREGSHVIVIDIA